MRRVLRASLIRSQHALIVHNGSKKTLYVMTPGLRFLEVLRKQSTRYHFGGLLGATLFKLENHVHIWIQQSLGILGMVNFFIRNVFF